MVSLLRLETLSLRVERHVDNAIKIAKYLNQHPNVLQLSESGRKQILQRRKISSQRAGSIFTLESKANRGWKEVYRKLEIFSHLANVADAKSLAIHPASTTHAQLSEEDQLAAEFTGYDKISIGIEAVEDLMMIWTGFKLEGVTDMPINIPDDLPAADILAGENIL